MLIVQRREILTVLENQRTFMTPLLIGVDIVIVLVLLHLLVLLLHLPLVLLHLLRTTRIIPHVVQVHLLLNVNIVLGRSSLLLGLHHHLVTTSHWLVWIHRIGIRVLSMLATHLLPIPIHHKMALVALTILLIAARIRILPRTITQRCHNHILHVVVNR